MIIFYDFDASPNCLKTKILLKELGIAFEERRMTRPELRGQPYGSQFPTAQAPAITDGELHLAESGAIALHLAHKFGRFVPESAERRALMYQALFVEASLLAPTVGGQGLFGELYKPEAERSHARIEELRAKAVRVGKILGELLGGRPYFAEELSIADFQLYAPVSKSLAHGVFGDAPRNIVEWCERLTARPTVQAAREEYVHYQRREKAA